MKKINTRLRVGDTVQITKGKDKGKKGKIVRFVESANKKSSKSVTKALVEGINMVKRHVKPGVVSKEGGIIDMEKPISVANVMYFDEKAKKPTKLGSKIVDGKKYRVSKVSGKVLEDK